MLSTAVPGGIQPFNGNTMTGGEDDMNATNQTKILLVNDESNIMQFLELALINERFQVQTASRCAACSHLLEQVNKVPFCMEDRRQKI